MLLGKRHLATLCYRDSYSGVCARC